jgi:hypothetical protein
VWCRLPPGTVSSRAFARTPSAEFGAGGQRAAQIPSGAQTAYQIAPDTAGLVTPVATTDPALTPLSNRAMVTHRRPFASSIRIGHQDDSQTVRVMARFQALPRIVRAALNASATAHYTGE